MNKINMYKEVPTEFHNKLRDTLDLLEEEKVVEQTKIIQKPSSFRLRKYATACAVALLVTSTITVGAGGLFKWHQTVRERLGTEQELEDKLTMQGAALPAEDTDTQANIKIQALQAVKTDDNFYLLAAFDWPKELAWNTDIVFEEADVISEQKFGGITANFAKEPDENGTVYVEMQLQGKSDVIYEEDIQVVLTNLIQTTKADYVGTLVEAEWKLTFPLPRDGGTKSFLAVQPLPLNGHKLTLEKIELNTFGIKLYAEENQGRHAAFYSNMKLVAVQFEDGSRVDNCVEVSQKSAAKDEDGSFYFNIELQVAVDIDKVTGLVFKEDGKEFVLALGEGAFSQVSKEWENTGMTDAEGMITAAEAGRVNLYDLMSQQYKTEAYEGSNDFTANDIKIKVEDLQLVYARLNYAILTDNHFLYLWDAACDSAEVIMNLADCNFEEEKGGDFAMMPGGEVLAVYPSDAMDKVYMVDMSNFETVEAEGKMFWPTPNYENYKNNFFKVVERSGLPKGFYATDGYEAQVSAYVLYSEDGSLENIRLINIAKD